MNDSDWWRLLRGWLHRKQRTVKRQVLFYDSPLRSRPNLIRRLEKRRVFSATGVFSNGVLDVQFQSGGSGDATLQADGSAFFLDANSNHSFDSGETFGNIVDLRQLNVSSPDAVGNFNWLGDFNAAPFDLPNSLGNVVQIDALESVSLKASFSTEGNVEVRIHGPIEIDEHIRVEGNLSLQSLDANLVDGASARVTVGNDLLLQAASPTTLNDDSTNHWLIQGNTHLQLSSPGGDRTTLEIAEAGVFEVGTVSLSSLDTTTYFDSDVTLANVDVQGSFELRATGDVTDIDTSIIKVRSNLSVSANSIILGETSTDRINTGTLTFASTSGVQIFEDSNILLTGNSHASHLLLSSTGSITERDFVDLNVSQDATFHALSIDLGFLPLDQLQFGSLTFEVQGVVSIYETGATLLRGASSAGSLLLSSTDLQTNLLGASLSVTGTARFAATSIDLGITRPGTMQFGNLNFDSLGSVFIFENSDATLSGLNRAGSLTLQASGRITSFAGTTLVVTQNAFFDGTSVLLGRQTDDSFQFGSLTFSASDTVSIAEKGAMAIAGANRAATLALDSQLSLTTLQDSSLAISGNASFRSGSISIGLSGLGTVIFGSLTFNSTGNVEIDEDDSTLVLGINTARSLNLESREALTNSADSQVTVTESATLAGSSISFGTKSTDIVHFGSLRFHSNDTVTIAEDSDTLLSGFSNAGRLDLQSSGVLSNEAFSQLTVLDNASFTATSISLGDQSSDFFSSDSLTFLATDSIRYLADSAIRLAGSSSAMSLVLSSTQQITNANNASLAITQNASFSATTISLGNATTDLINLGSITIHSSASTRISEDSGTTFSGESSVESLILAALGTIDNLPNARLITTLNASLSGLSIALGSAITDEIRFGSVLFSATGAVSIAEDDSTLLTGINSAASVSLSSLGPLANAPGAALLVTENATFVASSINLGNQISDFFAARTIQFQSAGLVDLALNSPVDLVGTNTANALNLGSTERITSLAHSTLSIAQNALLIAPVINLGNEAEDIVNFGSLTLQSTGSANISEDSESLLTGNNSALALSLSSTDAVRNLPNSSITVTQTALFSGRSLDLGNALMDHIVFGALTIRTAGIASVSEDDSILLTGNSEAQNITLRSLGEISNTDDSRLSIEDNASFISASTLIGSQPRDFFVSGSLTCNSTGFVSIAADATIRLLGSSSANSLSLSSSASILNLPDSSLVITKQAQFAGTEINLGNASYDLITFGELDFQASGSVNISEDDGMTLAALSSANSATLSSTHTINNLANSKLIIAQNALLTAASINLGHALSDQVLLGSVTLQSPGLISLEEDDSTLLSGDSNAEMFELRSLGEVRNASNSRLIVTDVALISGTSIRLGEASNDNIRLGALTFQSAGDVYILEDDSTVLTGSSNADRLVLTSAELITSASGFQLLISGNATFSAPSINLNTAGTDDVRIGSLTFQSLGTVSIGGCLAARLIGINFADSLYLSAKTEIFNETNTTLTVNQLAKFLAPSIELGNTIEDRFLFGSLNFQSVGLVEITEDDSTSLSGENSALDLRLSSLGAITNEASTYLTVQKSAGISGESISIGNQSSDQVLLGTLSFQANSFARLVIDSQVQFRGNSSAKSLELHAPSIANESNAALSIEDNAKLYSSLIDLGTANGDSINFGSLTIHSTDTVIIAEDSDLLLVGINEFSVARLTSAGLLSNNALSSVIVRTSAIFSALNINLGNALNDFADFKTLNFMSTASTAISSNGPLTLVGVNYAGTLRLDAVNQSIRNFDAIELQVVGNAWFVADQINIGNEASDLTKFGSLTFQTIDSTSISEDDATTLSDTSFAGSLKLVSNLAVTNLAGSKVIVTGNATLIAGSIDLGNASGDEVRFGTLMFGPLSTAQPGMVSIHEDDSTALTGASAANTLNLRSDGDITADRFSSLIVVGNASFEAANIDLGKSISAQLNFGTLTFSSPGTVSIFERDDMTLAGANKAHNLQLASMGSLTDERVTTLFVSDSASFLATSVRVADTHGDRFEVQSDSFFETFRRPAPYDRERGEVSIGVNHIGIANFGSVGFLAGYVDISEQSPSRLDGTFVNGLYLSSTILISATGRDTGAGVDAIVAGFASFYLRSGGSVLLKSMTIPEDPSRNGLLLQNRISGSVGVWGVTDQLLIRNLSTSSSVHGIPSQLNQLELWFPNASIDLGSSSIPIETLNVTGDLIVIAGVDAVDTSLVNYTLENFGDRFASISLDNAKINVGSDATFLAFGAITVGQQQSTELKVPHGTASFISLSGFPINLGTSSPQPDGLLLLPKIALYSAPFQHPILTNNIFASLDCSATLTSWEIPQPPHVRVSALEAKNLELFVNGWLLNDPGLKLNVAGSAILHANHILLANHLGDSVQIKGDLFAAATTSTKPGLPDNRGTINIGSLGIANFRSISLLAQDATIIENSDTVFGNPLDQQFVKTDIRGRLSIVSHGSITNTVAAGPFGSAGVFAHEAILKATQSIHLGFVNFNSAQLVAGENLPLTNRSLTPLNSNADQIGISILDQLDDSLKAGVTLQTNFISGETIAEVYRDFSFLSRFDINYAVYLLDVDGLQVTGVVATGAQPHIYLESRNGQDLIISGTILTASSTSQYGGTVVIAGGNLVFTEPGSIQSAANALAVNQVMTTSLFAGVFNGGEGIGGLNSTGRVLAPTGTAIDSPDFLIGRRQAVATQFGSHAERGFLSIVRYADGFSQLFDTSGEVAGTNTSTTAGNQSIVAAPRADNLVSVFQRSNFITDFFGQVELPTTVILRRSTDLFLFESSGSRDLNSTAIDLNSDSFGVQRVFAGLLNASFPLISEVRIFQPPLTAPVLTFLPSATTYTTQNDFEVRLVRQNTTGEVAIYRVNFDDRNQDGQPDSNEIPDPERIFIPTGEQRDLPGEIVLRSKDAQEAAAPTADRIREWIRKYQADPTKPAGVYSIIQNDEIRGPIVLRTFVLRDLPESSPPPPARDGSPPTREPQGVETKTDDQK